MMSNFEEIAYSIASLHATASATRNWMVQLHEPPQFLVQICDIPGFS